MGKATGFKEFSRAVEPYRPAKERVLDFKEIYTDHDDEKLAVQGARCMDCGVPFCQSGEDVLYITLFLNGMTLSIRTNGKKLLIS
jgi:hypothetical protein